MKTDLLAFNKYTQEHQMKEVESTSLFSANGSPTADGLLSGQIFGVTPYDRRTMMGYINLRGRYIHPLYYLRIFKRSYKEIDNIIKGSAKYKINDKGELEISDDKGAGSGIRFLYDNFDKIKFRNINTENEDDVELTIFKTNVKRVMKYDKNKIFINKFIVIPAAFRDISMDDKGMGIDELNELYKKLLNKINLRESNKEVALFDTKYIEFQVQITLVEIMNYFKGVLFGKYGLQRKRLFSRNVDYGARQVITAPSFDGNSFMGQQVDIDRSGLPLSTVVTNCQLFLIRRISTFLINLPILDAKGNPFTTEEKEMYYNTQLIKEYIEIYAHSWGERLNKIPTPDEKGYIQFSYTDSDDVDKTRALTLTDIMYMFAYQEIELTDKHALITRHPTMDTFNVIPTKIHVMSTVKTKRVIIDGVEYPFYPDIDSILDKYNLDDTDESIEASKELSGYFIESAKISNLHLPGMNGDLDGDKIIVRILFSDEANQECAEHLEKITSIFDLSMSNVKSLGKDAAQALYSMTAYTKSKANPADPEIVDRILAMNPDDITMSFLFKEVRLADTTKFKKLNDVHDMIKVSTSKIKYVDGNVDTVYCSLGQIILYKLLLEDVKYPIITEPWKSKVVRNMFNHCGNKIVAKDIPEEEKITLDDFKKLLNKYENFSMRMGSFINPSIDSDILVLPADIKKRKDKLLKENKEAIDNNDITVYSNIENEILDLAKAKHASNPSAEWFDSGEVGYKNEFKTMVLSVGALPQDTSFEKFEIVSNSLSEGIPKNKLMYATNAAIVGGYSRGKSPEEGGAIAKATGYVCQVIQIDKYGTDCGTKNFIEINISQACATEYIGRNIVIGSKTVLLTEDNIQNYVGQKVKMRSPLTCKNDKICSKCAGELIYSIVGYDEPVINYGMYLSKASSEIVQKRLKLSHNTTIDFCDLDSKCFTPSKKKRS